MIGRNGSIAFSFDLLGVMYEMARQSCEHLKVIQFYKVEGFNYYSRQLRANRSYTISNCLSDNSAKMVGNVIMNVSMV